MAGWVRTPLGGYQGCSFIAVLVLYIYVISGVQHCCIIIYNLNIVHSKQHNVRSSPFVCSRGKLWFICLVLELNKINVARTFCNNRKPCGSAKHHCLRHRSGYRYHCDVLFNVYIASTIRMLCDLSLVRL